MNTFGKIAGGIGLLLVLTSPITIVQSVPAGLVKFVVGLVLLGVWFAKGRQPGSSVSGNAFFYGSSALFAAIAFASLLAANFVVSKRNKTWDLTSRKLYSLSPQTINVLKDLQEPVKIIAFSEEIIPTVEDLLKRYQGETDKITFDFKDPNRANDLTKKYDVRQGQLAAVVIKNPGPNEKHQLVNLGSLANPADGEQTLTNALVKLGSVGQQKLYFVEGHGETPLDGPEEEMAPGRAPPSLAKLKVALEDDGYAPQTVNLTERGEVPLDASALVIVGARSKFTDRERSLLENYLGQGGRIIYFAEQGLEPDLDALLAKYGVQVDSGMVADSKRNAGKPYALVAKDFGDSDIVKPLKTARTGTIFLLSRGLTLLKEGLLPGVTASPLVLSSSTAWVETTPTEEPTLDSGEKAGVIPLAAVVTRDTHDVKDNKRNDEARVVVFGDSDLVINGYSVPPNRDMVLNSIAWATQQVRKITIRPPDRDTSTLELDQDKFSAIRLITMDVLPTLLLAVGLTIARTRRAR